MISLTKSYNINIIQNDNTYHNFTRMLYNESNYHLVDKNLFEEYYYKNETECKEKNNNENMSNVNSFFSFDYF